MARSRSIAKRTRSSRFCWQLFAISLLYGALQAVNSTGCSDTTFVLPPRTRAPAREGVDFSLADASTAASTANLAKSIVGAGVLSLPSGAAKVFDAAQQGASDSIEHTSGIAALLLLYLLFGILNAGGFYLIGQVCERTGARTYQEAWSKTLGDQLEWLPSAASLVCSFTGMVACISVLGDTMSELAMTVSQDFVPKEMHGQLVNGISTFVLLPLCLLPSLSPLAFASVLGLAGVCTLAIVMTVRCMDGSYAPGGQFYSDARAAVEGLSQVAAPQGHSLFQQTFVFAAVLSNAFTAHFNAPAIFNELQPRPRGGSGGSGSSGGSRLPQFAIVTLAAFFLSGLIFAVITVTGVETFGMSGGPSILANYSSADPLSWIAKIGLGSCVLFEFPLLERCFRKTFVELFRIPRLEQHFLTVAASVASAVALASVPDFGLDKTSAIGGALGASFLVYVAPALMALQLQSSKDSKDPKQSKVDSDGATRIILQGVAGLGSVIGGLGIADAMQA
eukprot:Skav203888  [mRNA]  locus=scaffold1649:113977:115494:+ [translate_table: standard]